MVPRDLAVWCIVCFWLYKKNIVFQILSGVAVCLRWSFIAFHIAVLSAPSVSVSRVSCVVSCVM